MVDKWVYSKEGWKGIYPLLSDHVQAQHGTLMCVFANKNLYLCVYMNTVKAKKATLLPKEQRILAQLGENIKLARLRRRLTTTQVSERANIGRTTLWHVEKGSEHIAIGTFLQVLSVLGLTDDFKSVARDDSLGRRLQDANLTPKKRGGN